ncbi:MAG: SDR family oxidoreductase [Candidatus Omnitrophota bacterium]
MNEKHILVTGANGFIGKRLCQMLFAAGFKVRAVTRKPNVENFQKYECVCIGDISSVTDWGEVFFNVDTVIHLAGRTHIFDRAGEDSLADFRKVNVLGTERLALAARKAGVKRFIFISSVKVNGEGIRRPYTENDTLNPQDAYGISKREAEDALYRVAKENGLEIVILRPPLVYGPGVKANFNKLIKIAEFGLPLPFKGIDNRRSLVYLDNLIDAIATCIKHPKAAGETFMISDGQDVSTPELIKMISLGLGRKPVLFSLHPSVLRVLSGIAGKEKEMEKLTGTLLVDSSKIRNILGWVPLFTLEEGIKKTVRI